MKTKAYIVANNEVVATVTTDLKNGAEVKYAYNTCAEEINANRDKNLVSAKTGKVSRAQKWAKKDHGEYDVATEINTAEFHIHQ